MKSKLEKAFDEFEDIYNLMKPYALMREMGIDKKDAKKLSTWYEDIFYKQVIDVYKRSKK